MIFEPTTTQSLSHGLFSDFQYSFRSSRSSSDLLAVVSDKTERLLTGLELLEQ